MLSSFALEISNWLEVILIFIGLARLYNYAFVHALNHADFSAWFKNDHKKVTLVLDLLIDSVYD